MSARFCNSTWEEQLRLGLESDLKYKKEVTLETKQPFGENSCFISIALKVVAVPADSMVFTFK